MEKLTQQEEETMLYVWKLGSCFVKDILEQYEDPKPPYTTLASIVKNLVHKHYLKARKLGNTYEYTPLIAQTDYKNHFINGVVQNYFENSYKEMVSFFAGEQKISTDELKEIIALIEKQKKN